MHSYYSYFQFEWPDEKEDGGIRETKVIYTFQYLPAGLFNRAQVSLVIWLNIIVILKIYQYCDIHVYLSWLEFF